jgi:hypothetical protein
VWGSSRGLGGERNRSGCGCLVRLTHNIKFQVSFEHHIVYFCLTDSIERHRMRYIVEVTLATKAVGILRDSIKVHMSALTTLKTIFSNHTRQQSINSPAYQLVGSIKHSEEAVKKLFLCALILFFLIPYWVGVYKIGQWVIALFMH